MASEFDLIQRFFSRPTPRAVLGGGDDAALMRVADGEELVVSSDMLVEGVHFFADVPPYDLGWKTLAVNVSDLAAMGAQPHWATLALSLPRADESWLQAFADGFYACAERFGVDLVGGDTTRGPLTLCVTIFGCVPAGQALRRDGAQPGDDLWISGEPGQAALGLAALSDAVTLDAETHARCVRALQRPEPRLQVGLALRALATAMLDVSDGLMGDLRHILMRSGVGATLEAEALPWPAAAAHPSLALETRQRALLQGGDDYELLFTAPRTQRTAVDALSKQLNLPLHRIGSITPDAGVLQINGLSAALSHSLHGLGYDHFR